MNATNLFVFRWALATVLMIASSAALAQNPPARTPAPKAVGTDRQPGEMITRVYLVSDLVFAPRNYPFEGIGAVGSYGRSADNETFSGGGGGFGGGGFGGGGGGLGGGKGGLFGGGGFSVPDSGDPPAASSPAAAPAPSPGELPAGATGQLINAIQVSIRPQSWATRGGQGTVVALGGRMIVTQSAEIHEEIEKLLHALRNEGAARNGHGARLVDAARQRPVFEAGGRRAANFAGASQSQTT